MIDIRLGNPLGQAELAASRADGAPAKTEPRIR